MKTLAHKLFYYLEFIHCLLTQKEINASPLPVFLLLSYYYDIEKIMFDIISCILVGVTLVEAVFFLSHLHFFEYC